MKPTVCQIVLFCTRLSSLKFAQRVCEIAKHPAVITHVWDDTKVNLHVLADGSNSFPKLAVTNDSSKDSWWECLERKEDIQDAEFREVK